MTAKPHVVVVDDEADIRDTIAEYLSLHGFDVTPADGGAALKRVLAGERPIDVVILDLNMPGEDGLTLARYLRERSRVGIIILTAAGEVVDRVVGLEVGADDYVTKPFDLRELLARVKSVMRRIAPDAAVAGPGKANRVHFGDFRLDLEAHKLFGAGGREVPLTSMEFDLLRAFATHPNKALTRDQLLELAHKRDWEPFDRSIDVRVTRLRRKIEKDPAKPRLIKTVHGVGYIFAPDGAD